MRAIDRTQCTVAGTPTRRVRPRRTLAVLLVAVLTSVVVPAGAASATATSEVIDEPRIYVFEDDEIAILWNTTRESFCTWAEGGFEGDFPALEPVPVRYRETGNGVVMVDLRATRTLEVWRFGPGEDLRDLCELPDGSTPWATGEARLTNTDNDWDISGTRAASWGFRGQGTVTDVDGDAWRISWVSQSQINPNGWFDRLVNHAQVSRTGPR